MKVNFDRFRLNVNVPLFTLMGVATIPGSIDGLTPIPARELPDIAARFPEWEIIVTGPATSMPLSTIPPRYASTARMIEHLRGLYPVCATPNCTRRTVGTAEIDHFGEYDHKNPESGGQTIIENLHILCGYHHQKKTAREMDPEVIPSDELTARVCAEWAEAHPDDEPIPPDLPRAVTSVPTTRWDLRNGVTAKTTAYTDLHSAQLNLEAYEQLIETVHDPGPPPF